MHGKQIQDNRHGQSGAKSSPRLSSQEIIDELMACLALVRPVSMGADHVKEWLVVAMREVKDMRPSAFKAGCAEARQECTHHGQIVPKILNGKSAQGWRDIGASPFLPRPVEQPLALENPEAAKLIAAAAKAITVEG